MAKVHKARSARRTRDELTVSHVSGSSRNCGPIRSLPQSTC